MRRVLLVSALVLGCPAAQALDPALYRDLRLQHEQLPRGTRFNGVAVHALRLAGPDVEVLERRWLDRASGIGTRRSDAAGWRVHSRLYAGHSEVLQVRGSGKDGEAIWSRVELSAPPRATARGTLATPRGCHPGPNVESVGHGRRTLQSTLVCAAGITTLLQELESSAVRAGGLAVHREASGLTARVRDREISVTAVPLAEGRTALVWFEHSAGSLP